VNRIFKREFALIGQQQDGERSDRIGSWEQVVSDTKNEPITNWAVLPRGSDRIKAFDGMNPSIVIRSKVPLRRFGGRRCVPGRRGFRLPSISASLAACELC
jgi:hypothetical protein